MLLRYLIAFVVLAVVAIAFVGMRRHAQAERAEAAARLERLRREDIARDLARFDVCRQQSVGTVARLKALAEDRRQQLRHVA